MEQKDLGIYMSLSSSFLCRLCVLVVWLPPFIRDRIHYSQPGICIWSTDNNREFVVFVALAGYHGPSLIMIYCYIKVFLVMRRNGAAFVSKVTPSVTFSSDRTTTVSVRTIRAQQPLEGDAFSNTASITQQSLTVNKKQDQAVKERKIFISLSYILVAYLVTWSPFHVIFDILFFDPNGVSSEWYGFGYIMAFFNSTLNPILYAASSRDFRVAFKHILTGKACRWMVLLLENWTLDGFYHSSRIWPQVSSIWMSCDHENPPSPTFQKSA